MELHYQAKNSGFEAIINERALSERGAYLRVLALTRMPEAISSPVQVHVQRIMFGESTGTGEPPTDKSPPSSITRSRGLVAPGKI